MKNASMRAQTPVTPAPLEAAGRNVIIGLLAFLTVVDLFAAQAILPSLAKTYGVGAATMSLAVNACTLGMAISAAAVSLFAARIDRRRGIVGSLLILAVLTILLAAAPDLGSFAALRVGQGLCMAAAFALTLGYLGEEYASANAASAVAAYVAGNVASNLFGRLVAAGVADHLGIAATFQVFALLNLAGAGLAAITVHRMISSVPAARMLGTPSAWLIHIRDRQLRAAFGVGFCILFAFIGTFSYVNFVLALPPFSLSAMQLGFVYFVFVPSLVATPLAGRAVLRFGAPCAARAALGLACLGALLLLSPRLPTVITGLMLVGVGTFFAQAVATSYVGRAARGDRAAASGLYLASYFSGGLAGSAALGILFSGFGWWACVAGICIALLAGAALAGSFADLSRPPKIPIFADRSQMTPAVRLLPRALRIFGTVVATAMILLSLVKLPRPPDHLVEQHVATSDRRVR